MKTSNITLRRLKTFLKSLENKFALKNHTHLSDSELSATSMNPVQNKVITKEFNHQSTEMLDIKMLGWTVPRECPIQNEVNGNQFIQKVGRVDLGELDWSYSTENWYVQAITPDNLKLPSSNSEVANIYNINYETASDSAVYNHKKDKTIGINTGGFIKAYDSSYTDAATFEQAMRGQYLYYELANYITKTIDGNEISMSKADKTEVPKLVKVDNKTVFLSEDGVLSAKGGGTTIIPKPTVNPAIKSDNAKVTITWQDPTDVIYDGAVFSKWAGTKLVMKESGYPTSPDDGTLLVDCTERDKYKKNGYVKEGLINDKVYYFALFPYSTDGVYNYDAGNRLLGEPCVLKIVTFADGTDEEIAAMIQAHYDNKINIADYWAVGDKRSVNLSAMSATYVGESHRAQTVQFAIADFEKDELSTAINGHTKAAITLTQVDCLMDASNASNPVNGSSNSENGYMNSSDTNSGGWTDCARRKWCNDVYYNALPSVFKSMVKEVNKKTSAGNQSSTINTTKDKAFLLSESEIYSSTTYSKPGEGSQYEYYKTTANRYKLPKWSSSSSSHIYWQRSPRSGSGSYFCRVSYGGSASSDGASYTCGCAPCLCI